VALRHTRNPHQAEEITQAVFVILAKKSRSLSQSVILSGWLCRAARLTAITLLRGEIRRARREQEAYMQNLQGGGEPDVWPQIAPLLDAAMAGLGEKDHHAIVLRFYDGKSMQEVGAALGASEDAAKKRVNRALEKLRRFFAKRGVVISAAVLMASISANSVQAAPAVLVKTATSLALATGMAPSASTLTLIKGAMKLMACSNTKACVIACASLLLVGGTARIVVSEVVSRRGENWQQSYNESVSILDSIRPQTRILPALPRNPNLDSWGGRNGKLVGVGVQSSEILQAAYDATAGRMIFSDPPPEGKFDFISTQPKGQEVALQQAVKNEFGLVGRREMIETNVLVLTLRKSDMPGLAPNNDSANQNNNRSPNSINCVSAPVSKLAEFLENALGTPVVDHTGLSGRFDMYVKWDGTSDGLKRAMLEQMGLELVPGRDTVEFLIVDAAK
jgi:uncharacterized protein (TIGR03435 family)